jgi:hypothetical protein
VIAWYDGVPPSAALVRCGGEDHRLTWQRGRLVVEDHDVPAELALVGLGGASCACLDLFLVCREGFDVDDLFLLWTEQAEPSVGASQALERWARRAGVRRGGLDVASRRADERRASLLASLPVEFRRRLALGIFRSVAREPDDRPSASHPSFAPVFGSLVTSAVRASLGRELVGGALDVRWSLSPTGGSSGVDGRRGERGGWIGFRLSPGWVPEVWAWGLAVVDGHLVADVVDRRSRRLVEADLVSWDRAGRPQLSRRSVRRTASGWHLCG